MRLTLFLLSFAACVLTAGFFSAFSHAAAPVGNEVNLVPPVPQNMHLGWTGTYFSSNENFSSSGGGFSTLGNGGKYQEFKNFFRADYDWNSRWRLKTDFGFHNVMAETSIYDHSNMHVDQIGLGAEWWNALGRMPLITHARLGVPLFEPDFASTEPFATDGAMTVEVGAFLRPRLGPLVGKFGAGYLWRNDGFSDLVPWTAGVTYVLPVGQIGGGARGFHTVMSDESSTAERARRTLAIQNIQGGSLKYGSVDPSLQQLFAESRWGLMRGLDFSTDAAYDINGESYGKGFYVGIGVHWLMNWGHGFGGHDGYEDDVSQERNSFGRSRRAREDADMDAVEESFEVERGDDRQKYFNDSDPSVAPAPAKKTKARPQPSARQKKRGSSLPSPNVKLRPKSGGN